MFCFCVCVCVCLCIKHKTLQSVALMYLSMMYLSTVECSAVMCNCCSHDDGHSSTLFAVGQEHYQKSRNLGQQVWLPAVMYWLRCRTRNNMAVSVPVLSQWRWWVDTNAAFLLARELVSTIFMRTKPSQNIPVNLRSGDHKSWTGEKLSPPVVMSSSKDGRRHKQKKVIFEK